MKYGMLRIFLLFLPVCFLFPVSGYGQITIDGIPDEPEWAGAQTITDFVVIDPLTFDSPRLPTEVKVLSVQEGLAIGCICGQPAGHVSRGARPDRLRFAEIPKSFKGALLVPELKRAYEISLRQQR